MFDAWWVSFGISGLPVAVGVLVWIILRDRERKRRAKEERLREILREAGVSNNDITPTTKDLEKQFQNKQH